MIELIQRLKECGINTKYEKIQIDDRFAGKDFCSHRHFADT